MTRHIMFNQNYEYVGSTRTEADKWYKIDILLDWDSGSIKNAYLYINDKFEVR